ncbi:hypothetical protein KSP39_PZI005515 [Platanthera zijinensis]|uniref:Btz domain-containing protein n=1 Tax=Platanthera zijinensis TaxID=2320716 RepID=A0AAP0BS48_9ASPA
MADGEELEYDSDPEDALRPSLMRRREASDDENGEGSCDEREIKTVRRERLRAGSDDESEGEGSARGYVDEEEYEEQDEEEMLEDEADEDGAEGGSGANVLEKTVGAALLSEECGVRSGGDVYRENNQAQEGEKKESEPFAVPTAGAFYMHDDRFEENGRGRHRRMAGGRRLWESKDDQAWVHDRFEEMKLQDRRNEDGRMPRGRFRGRGSRRGRGAGRGYDRGNRPRAYYGDNSNQNVLKSVRGRGPVRYEPLSNNIESYPKQTKRNQKTQEMALDNISAKFPQISDGRPESVAPRKQTFASSLSSASPPFYPSGSSNQDMAASQKRDMQAGSNTKPLSSTTQMENYFSTPHPPSLFRGKTVVDSVGFDRLHLDDSDHQIPGKAPVHPTMHASGSSLSLSNANKSPAYKVQEKNSNSTSIHSHPTSFNQVGRIPWQNQPPVVQQKPVQSPGPHSLKNSNQPVAQHLLIGNQVASPPQASVGISSEGEEAEAIPGTSTQNSTFRKGKLINQGAGRGPFLYGGAQIIGPTEAAGLPHGDQNFAGTPALLPVMQFRGQHPRGLGVPAVGMALPGYVAQPGFGNSEMTWVPVLAGAAGALGASYCSPYITLDGNYYAHPSGQASTSISSISALWMFFRHEYTYTLMQ